MVKQDHPILQTKRVSITNLYDAYAGMLLGYICEVVKDRKLAEDYLVKTFRRIAQDFNKVNWGEVNVWCQLQRFAKNELAGLQKTPEGGKTAATLPNIYLDQMTNDQKMIFCNIYYSKKNTAQLAKETAKPEAEVKELLKEAFAVIRRLHETLGHT